MDLQRTRKPKLNPRFRVYVEGRGNVLSGYFYRLISIITPVRSPFGVLISLLLPRPSKQGLSDGGFRNLGLGLGV